jgi:translocator protein
MILYSYRYELLGAIFCLTMGFLSGFLVSTGDFSWYANITKPSFNPPNYIFGPVWSILYIFMGIVFGKIIKDFNNNKPLFYCFIIQFLLNLSWTPIFFYFHKIDLALINLILLWASIFIFLALSFNKRLLFWLFVPYFIWVSFAGILNFYIYKLNII